jgi:hypothetical protein
VAKISPLKTGLFIENVLIKNGAVSVRVMMKTRTLKWLGKADTDVLYQDDRCPVTWDVYPQSPSRLVRVVSGRHPVVGAFHVRFDFPLRYVTPHFRNFSRWDLAGGILVRGSGKVRAGVLPATFKQAIRRAHRTD